MSEASITMILARSLDALSLRSQAIAHNIANAGSVNFRPIRVNFEAELREAAAVGNEALSAMQILPIEDPQFVPGEELRLDLELVDAAQTSMRYAALIDMMGRRMAIARTIAGGGQ
jgi:flagellar basal-body rod protein FlgB